jgi:hypothetical protein
MTARGDILSDNGRGYDFEPVFSSTDLRRWIEVAPDYLPGTLQTTGYTWGLFKDYGDEDLMSDDLPRRLHNREVDSRMERYDELLENGVELTLAVARTAFTEVVDHNPALTLGSLSRTEAILGEYNNLKLHIYDPTRISTPLRSLAQVHNQAYLDGRQEPVVLIYDGIYHAPAGTTAARQLPKALTRLIENPATITGDEALEFVQASRVAVERMRQTE